MKHPSIDQLALYSGGELPWWRGLLVRRHVDGCTSCQQEIASFRQCALEAAAEVDVMPMLAQWDRLAAEMRANIRLGLEASEAISAYPGAPMTPTAHALGWKMAILATGLALAISAGFWFNAVKKAEYRFAMRTPESVVVEASQRGVGLSDGNRSLELKSAAGNQRTAILSVSTEGVAGSRYVDEETGQVTVNNVYQE